MSIDWNPWHGCFKKSEGCLNCYVYRRDIQNKIDSTQIYQTKNFDLPIRKKKDGSYYVKSNETIFTCFTSDFFLEEADDYRLLAWKMIKERNDCIFFIVTKRIERFYINLPMDWNQGYKNVIICCTCENQKRADERLPMFVKLPIIHKRIICEPLLESITLSQYLDESNNIEGVTVGGESGEKARICDYDWVLKIRNECLITKTNFYFKQTGAKFRKDQKIYLISRDKQLLQASKANIDLFF